MSTIPSYSKKDGGAISRLVPAKSTFGKWWTVGKYRGIDDQASLIETALVPLDPCFRRSR